MILKDHHSVFSDHAWSMKSSAACNWEDGSNPYRWLAMNSFFELHAGMTGLIQQTTGRKLSVAPGVMKNDQPNAFAALHGDVHVIGITTGLENAILDIVDEAFSKSYVFRSGDRRETFLMTMLGNVIPVEQLAPLEPDLAVLDDHRAKAMTYVIIVMYRFALLHELAHCLKGHVDYLAERGTSLGGGLDELNISTRSKTNARILTKGERHVLEFDADYSALISCMRIEGLGYDRLYSGVFDPVTRFEYSMFAIYAMTWLLSSVESDKQTDTHPEPARRLSLLSTAAASFIGHSRRELVWNNHYALSQLKAVEHRVRTGWMELEDDTAPHFDVKDHRSVWQKMMPYAYEFADSNSEDDV